MHKKIFKSTIKYLREVSIVMLGLTISLSINTYLNNRNERKDIALFLKAIFVEVEENIASLETHREIIEREMELYEYLTQTERESICDEVMASYQDIMEMVHNISFRTRAFEMLQNSGMMRFISDRELMVSLWDTYSALDMINEYIVELNDFKRIDAGKALTDPNHFPLHYYFIVGQAPIIKNQILDQVEEILVNIKDQLSRSRLIK